MIQLVEIASNCLGKGNLFANVLASNGLRDGNVILDEQVVHTRFCTGKDDVAIACKDYVVITVVELHGMCFVQV